MHTAGDEHSAVEQWTVAEMHELARAIVAAGDRGEKRGASPYRRGRSRDWLKIKTAHGRAIDEERAKWNER